MPIERRRTFPNPEDSTTLRGDIAVLYFCVAVVLLLVTGWVGS